MRGGDTKKQAQASDVRGLSVKGACRTRVANGHQMRWRTSSVGCLCLPPRASGGGVASGCRRTNVEARRGHHPHATSATTREDWRSSARDAPSRAESPRKDMVVWPVQEPVVEMVLSLSGARLKMTVLGLLKAPHMSMHETPIEMPFQCGQGRRRAAIGCLCLYVKLAATTLLAARTSTTVANYVAN